MRLRWLSHVSPAGHSRSRPLWLPLLGVVLVSGGCSDQLLDSAPERPAPAAPAHAFAPTVGGVSFVGSVPVPGTNLIEQGKVPWADLGQTFTEHGWVELRTSGEVSYNINWDAQYGSCGMYCIGVNAWPGHGEGTTGAAGIPGAEYRLRVKLASALQNPGESYQGAGLVVTPDRQVYTLVEVGPGSRLWGGRSGISGVRGGIPWYFLGGMTSVEVRRVEPVQVQPNKTRFTPGEVLTWTTQLYPGVEGLHWRFQSPGHSDVTVGCRDQTVCEWAPPRPGRMRVDGKWTAAWPGPLVYGYSPEVTDKPQEPKLALECTGGVVQANGSVSQEKGRVTRGQVLRCLASNDPASPPGELAIDGWSFDGRPRTDGAPASTTWEGVMVRGGTVRVTGSVGDRTAKPAEASITVLDRDWKYKRVPFRIEEDIEDQIPVRELPKSSEDLGKFYPRVKVADLESMIPSVTTGPNSGLAYLTDLPFSVVGLIRVNRIALAEGSAFWLRQSHHRYITPLGEDRCGRSDVVPFISVVLEHEGMTMGPKSHAFFFNEELQRHDPQPIEGLTSSTDTEDGINGAQSEIIERAQQWFNLVWLTAAESDDKADLKSNRPTYCIFRYFN